MNTTFTTSQIRAALAERGIVAKGNNKPFLAKKLATVLAAETAARVEIEAQAKAQAKAQAAAQAAQAAQAAAQTSGAAPFELVAPKAPLKHDAVIPPVGSTLVHYYSEASGRAPTIATVLPDGLFSYQGQIFDNLGAIAKLASGQIWNGKMFFRLIPYPRHGAKAARLAAQAA